MTGKTQAAYVENAERRRIMAAAIEEYEAVSGPTLVTMYAYVNECLVQLGQARGTPAELEAVLA